MSKLKPGDKVVLVGPMTIKQVFGDNVVCEWREGNETKVGICAAEMLKPAPRGTLTEISNENSAIP